MANTGKGKALVTRSTEFGAVYADRLATGYDLVVVARNGKQLQELADRLRRRPDARSRCCRPPPMTSTSPSREQLATDPQVTLLVNNAGIAANGNSPSTTAHRSTT